MATRHGVGPRSNFLRPRVTQSKEVKFNLKILVRFRGFTVFRTLLEELQ